MRNVNRHEELNDIVVLSNLVHIKLFSGKELIGEMNNTEAMKVFNIQ
ncbi:MAG: hypothetical protein K0R31_242 [Clostridiales bacterium]|nr:hypothetical protein [Clostridiales bacterium]